MKIINFYKNYFIFNLYMSHNSYINLKVNGRLFPSWLLLNFKKYKLPEVLQIEGDDPCKRKTKLELRKYQEFLSVFLDYRSPYKDILVYHGMGSGKTGTVINPPPIPNNPATKPTGTAVNIINKII